MTNLTVTDVYIIGLPIIFMLMMAEATVSQYQNKKYYKNKDTLYGGLVVENIPYEPHNQRGNIGATFFPYH